MVYVIIFFMFWIFAGVAHSWGTSTHEKITKKAFQLLGDDKPEASAFYLKRFAQYRPQIAAGAVDPDWTEKAMGTHYYIYPGSGKNKGQYYKGATLTLNPGVTARTRLEEHLSSAKTQFCTKNYLTAFLELGRALHYLEDIGCPAHSGGIQYRVIRKNVHALFEELVDRSRIKEFRIVSNENVYRDFETRDLGWILNDLSMKAWMYRNDILGGTEEGYMTAGHATVPLSVYYTTAFLDMFYKQVKDCENGTHTQTVNHDYQWDMHNMFMGDSM